MSHRDTLSAYTPSNTDPELLERIFVQRERLLKKTVDRLVRSMSGEDKHHALLVGPRGSGKTHLVSLVVHRLRNRPEIAESMRIAWLGEDDTFAGLIDIALGIADQLAIAYPDEFPANHREALHGLSADDAARASLNKVVERLAGRSMVLVTENMDRMFKGLGDSGQKAWRAFLQESRRFATLATAQQLFDGVASREEPFFGFFDIQHLKALSVDDARELIRKISVEQGKDDLVAYLNGSEGRYRVRALHYLAGGNHRMYVMLAEFLTKDSLDDLVEAFEKLAEKLTPYFQERLRSLPAQQAKLVECLCNTSGAMTVKEIAQETFIAEGNCSKQLGELKKKGYVQAQKRGKESLYELAEPLMRLCLEVKHQRGRPLKLVARFLKAWFPEDRLRADLDSGGPASSRIRQYRQSAIDIDGAFDQRISDTLQTEIRQCLGERRYEQAAELSEELYCVAPLSAGLLKAEAAFREHDYDRAIQELTAAIALPDALAEPVAKALLNRGVIYGQQSEVEKELADYSAAIALPDATTKQVAQALFNRGNTYGEQGEVEKQLADYSAAIALPDAPAEQVAMALVNRGVIYGRQGEVEKQLADYSAAIAVPGALAEPVAKALFNRGNTYGGQGEVRKQLADYSAAIALPDAPAEQVAMALVNRGVIYGRQGEVEKEIADYSAAISLPNAPAEPVAKALLNRGNTYGGQGEVRKQLADYSAAIAVPDAPAEQVAQALVNRGVIYGRQGEVEKEIADYSAAISLPGAPVDKVAMALVNRGVAYGQQGELAKGLADYSAAISLPGAPVDKVAMALVNRGVAYHHQGEVEKRITDYSDVISLSGAPAEHVARALVNRGYTYGQQGEVKKEIADYSATISLPDAPVSQVARALVYRGITYSQQGELVKGLTDYSAVISLADAPAEQVAEALLSRGAVYWRAGRYKESQRDFEGAIENPEGSLETKTLARFGLPEPMVAHCDRLDVVAALRSAFSESDPNSKGYGGTPHDLLSMVLRRGHQEWGEYVTDLVPVYVDHGAAAMLGQGLTRTIEVLDASDYSDAQRDVWNAAWQEAGQGCEDLEIALRSLDAATEAMKTKSDRALFRLPLEIRELVRPLLKQSLGE